MIKIRIKKIFMRGFTLIELLIVIAVLGVLAGGVIVAINPTAKINAANMAKAETFSASVQNNLAMDLVGEWTFNENTVNDTSGYGNITTNHGADCTNALDRKGQKKACSFNGSNYIDAGNAENLTLTTKATIEAWVYKRSSGATGSWPNIVGKNQFRIYNNPPNASDMNAYVVINGVGHWPQFSTNFPLNQWHHLVVTFNGDLASQNIKLYYDGGLVTIQDAPGTLSSGTEDVIIGGYWGGTSFDGLVDDVRIYKSALLSYQIKQLYAQGLARHLLAFKY